MTDFLQDLFDDLREKRLLPVAVALLAGIVAVPLLLMRSGGEAPSDEAPTPAAPDRTGSGALIGAVDAPGEGSDLGVFDPKDPFKSGMEAKKPGVGDGIAQLVTPTTTLPGSSSSGPAAGPSGGAAPAPKDFVPGNTGTAPSPSSPTPRPRMIRKNYMYVIDVKFGQTGNERTRKGVKRLEILPSDRNPVVVFLGASADAKKAVFLIDSRVSQSGEGACRPSVRSCTFLYLRDQDDRNEQFLTDDEGREYHLTLLDIRRVEVKRSSSKQAKASSRRIGAGRKVRFPALAPDVQR